MRNWQHEAEYRGNKNEKSEPRTKRMKVYGVEPLFRSDANKTLSLRAQNLKEINRFESSSEDTYCACLSL